MNKTTYVAIFVGIVTLMIVATIKFGEPGGRIALGDTENRRVASGVTGEAVLAGPVLKVGERDAVNAEKSDAPIFHGEILVIDAFGNTGRRAESGVITLDERGELTEMAFESGKWSYKPKSRESSVRIAGLVEGGRRLRVRNQQCLPGKRLEVVGYGYPGFFLEMYSTNDSSLVDEYVGVDRWRSARAADPVHPGNVKLMGGALVSGVEKYIPLSHVERQILWLRAAGHAWKCLDKKEVEDGGAVKEELSVGGSVKFAISNIGMVSGLQLFVEPLDSGYGFSRYRKIEGGGAEMRDLAVGKYEAHLSYRSLPTKGAEVSDRVKFEVTELCELEVGLEMVDSQEHVPGFLNGALMLEAVELWDGSAELNNLQLTIKSKTLNPEFEAMGQGKNVLNLKKADELPGSRGLWLWEFGVLPPGEYIATVVPIGYAVAFSVVSGEDTWCEIRVPELSKVVLSFIDESGNALTDAAISAPNSSVNRSIANGIATKEGGNEVTFLCLPGPTKIFCLRKGYGMAMHEWNFQPGWNAETVQMNPAK